MKQFEHWRDGRVVDYSGLENRRAERHRGFESLSLRKQDVKLSLGVFFVCVFEPGSQYPSEVYVLRKRVKLSSESSQLISGEAVNKIRMGRQVLKNKA